MIIDTAGKVGIGTDSPEQKLEIEGDVRIKDSRSLFFKRHGDNYAWRIRNESAQDNSTYGFDSSNDLVFEVVANSNTNATPAVGSHSVYPSSANTLVLKETGNVGIGTDTPTDTYNYGKVLDIHGSTGAVTYLRDSDATSNFGFLAYDGGTTNRCVIGGGGSAYLRFISAGNETMSISANGALHIDNTMSYTGKSWLNEAVGGSTPVGGSNANVNTYQKLRLFVNGDINVNQGRGIHFGDVTDAAP